MELKKYQDFCQKLALPMEPKEKEILAWGLGISGEAGDVAGCIKKTYIHKDDKIDGIKENLGDTLWYIAMICNFYGWDLNEIIDENVDKLNKRYEKGISFKAAARKGEKKDWNEQ
jgi:NTP pyrophosphatase (non-canonical NTP hydrolase)